MPASLRSDSGFQHAQCLEDETCEFLLETDRERGWCSKQPVLDAAQIKDTAHQCRHRDVRFQCPTWTCYAARHWLSVIIKNWIIGLCNSRVLIG